MTGIVILCVEDEREVLDALVRDLEPFAEAFQVEAAEGVEEARRVVRQCLEKDQWIGLVLADHLMPGASGVDLLVELNHNPATAATRKVLVTAHAGLRETVRAVNEADLNHYIAKPWTVEELHAVVRKQLTDYVIQRVGNLLPYEKVLDSQRIREAIRESSKA